MIRINKKKEREILSSLHSINKESLSYYHSTLFTFFFNFVLLHIGFEIFRVFEKCIFFFFWEKLGLFKINGTRVMIILSNM